LGPGQMWEAARDRIRAQGGAIRLDSRVVRIEHDGSAVTAFVAVDSQGKTTQYLGSQFLSTLAVRDTVVAVESLPPPAGVSAANALKYRDFITVVLIVDSPETFPDTWIYVHEPNVRVGRIQNFKNWSPDLVPDASKSSLGMEYFCFEGDDLWN